VIRKDLIQNYIYVINTTFNICEFLNGTNNNPVAKVLIDLFKNSLPKGILHPCPMLVSLRATTWLLMDSRMQRSSWWEVIDVF
jgi:hypothetical protein